MAMMVQPRYRSQEVWLSSSRCHRPTPVVFVHITLLRVYRPAVPNTLPLRPRNPIISRLQVNRAFLLASTVPASFIDFCPSITTLPGAGHAIAVSPRITCHPPSAPKMPPRPGTSEPWSTSSEVSDAIFIRLGMKTLRELAGDNAYVPGNHISLGVKLGEGAYAGELRAVWVAPTYQLRLAILHMAKASHLPVGLYHTCAIPPGSTTTSCVRCCAPSLACSCAGGRVRGPSP